MKTLSLLFVMVFGASLSFSQGAGNYMFNQSKSSKKDYAAYDYETQRNQSYDYFAPSAPAMPRANDTVCYLQATVLMNVEPDSYVIILGTSQVGESLDVCHQLLDQRIADFLEAIAPDGISTNDLYVDFISQAPIFSYEEEKSLFSKKYVKVPKGFELKKNLHIKYTQRQQADKIIKAAANAEIYDIIKVDYIVNDKHVILDTMRKHCIDILNDKTTDYSAMGIKNPIMYRTYEETHYCYYPLQRYEGFVSYTPDNSKALSATAGLVNENAKINLYYNKLPDNTFDKVINPEVLEPVLQFSYTVRLKTVFSKN